MRATLAAVLAASLTAVPAAVPVAAQQDAAPETCALELVVLGAGQDAGAPQIGHAGDTGPRLLPTSLGVIDHEAGQRFLFEATPAITDQLHALDRIAPGNPDAPGGLGLDAVLLTHAHIGHYLGLAQFGRESAGASGQIVLAMPRMAQFLRTNGPWSQLVELGNITLIELPGEGLVPISDNFGVWPLLMPHRDEYSETVGYLMMTPGKTALFVPDLDSWEAWEARSGDTLEALLARVDFAMVDATFWDNNELSGRDMTEIPHPRVSATMARLQALPARERAKLHFIHYNHTNPVRDPASTQSAEVTARGFNVAREGDRHCLFGG